MEVKVISKKLVKPSTPTPSSLQTISISFLDQLLTPSTSNMVFYYPANSNFHPLDDHQEVGKRKQLLEKSLSETLTLYYPLAGRYIKENASISCNDEGVEYIEAVVDGQLSQVLRAEFDVKEIDSFTPTDFEESASSPLMAIQINIFSCGGLAIGSRCSHRILDAFTFSLFMNGWAKACRVGINDVASPSFEAGVLFPPKDISCLSTTKFDRAATKRFVFNAKTLSKLKADHQAMGLNHRPSTTEVLIALIWKAQIDAARARHGHSRSSLLVMMMNLRGKTFLKIPENCCGNLFTRCTSRFEAAVNSESKMGLKLNDFVDKVSVAVRNSVMEHQARVPTKGGGHDDQDGLLLFSNLIMKPYMDFSADMRKGEGDVRVFSSLTKMPFYEVDFGWGGPAWVSFGPRPYPGVLLLDTKDGDGVEAWVTMDKDELAFLSKDPNLVLSMD